MDDKIRLLQSQLGESRIKQNTLLSDYLTSPKIAGKKAAALFVATSERELIQIVSLCQELSLVYQVVGSGSKLMGDFGGLYIKNRFDLAKISAIKGKVTTDGLGVEEAMVEVGSGLSLIGLAEFAKKQRLTGFESLNATPGTVGGSLSYDPVLRSKLHQARVITIQGEIEEVRLAGIKSSDIILAAIFRLKSAAKLV